eukprot:CAMPEP_0206471920 /NCGR_PEP_ID=MMETSP0324_2-20121206/31867_1 /ASSEMBLY_ACC=CAM_ASM_000836 /TAXON_ID=2866 /ORGANISM="Crypthecodinium cohnii, Strain Seligo" /LENGTH=51 /DNA_ID=CAMNT_0053946371 /DNA_START=472 /DNA_END=624 /DNA_ORIENTATION=-
MSLRSEAAVSVSNTRQLFLQVPIQDNNSTILDEDLHCQAESSHYFLGNPKK